MLLGFTAFRTINKGLDQYRKETIAQENALKNELHKALDQKEKEVELEQSSPLLGDVEKRPEEKTPDELELMELLESEKKTPVDKVIFLIVMFVVVVFLTLMKGGGGKFASPLGIVCGTTAYWELVVANLAWLIGLSLYARSGLIKSWRKKRRLRYKFLQGDVEWNERNTIVYPLLCVFAGLCAGLFGVGGGIVKGPLMLEMGVHPMVSAATSAVMILFTTISATTTFIAFGLLIYDYAVYLFFFGLVGTCLGQLIVGHYVKKYNRSSLISLSIGAVVGLSTVLMGVEAIYSLVTAEDQESGTFCS